MDKAQEALLTIIAKKCPDETANVIPKVGTFRQACRNGGIKLNRFTLPTRVSHIVN